MGSSQSPSIHLSFSLPVALGVTSTPKYHQGNNILLFPLQTVLLGAKFVSFPPAATSPLSSTRISCLGLKKVSAATVSAPDPPKVLPSIHNLRAEARKTMGGNNWTGGSVNFDVGHCCRWKPYRGATVPHLAVRREVLHDGCDRERDALPFPSSIAKQ